jgi:hypothetical protein
MTMTMTFAKPIFILTAWSALLAGTGLVGCGGSGGGVRGTGGSTGSGGTTGSDAALDGVTGLGGATVVPLSCNPGVNPADALITDFSTWKTSTGKWTTPSADLTGSKYSAGSGNPAIDGGVLSNITNTVTADANPAYVLSGSVRAADYGFGLLSFDSCVNTSKFSGIQFTLGGTAAGCDIIFQVQTFSQQAVSNKGGCSASCYNFPRIKVQIGAASVVVTFADLAGTGSPTAAADIPKEIVGLQWQFQPAAPVDGGAQADCVGINMTIDDVQFVP